MPRLLVFSLQHRFPIHKLGAAVAPILVFLLHWASPEMPIVSTITLQMQSQLQDPSRLKCMDVKTRDPNVSRKNGKWTRLFPRTRDRMFAMVTISTSTFNVNCHVLKGSTLTRMPAPRTKMSRALPRDLPCQGATPALLHLRVRTTPRQRIGKVAPMENIATVATANFSVTTILSKRPPRRIFRKCAIDYVCGSLLRNAIPRHRTLPLPPRVAHRICHITSHINSITWITTLRWRLA